MTGSCITQVIAEAPHAAPEHWYRYADYAVGDGESSHDLRVALHEYRVDRRTPCGVWLLIDGWSSYSPMTRNRRWVNNTARKRFACATREEAWTSFRFRKRRQVGIYRHRLGDAEKAYAFAQGEMPEGINVEVPEHLFQSTRTRGGEDGDAS